MSTYDHGVYVYVYTVESFYHITIGNYALACPKKHYVVNFFMLIKPTELCGTLNLQKFFGTRPTF